MRVIVDIRNSPYINIDGRSVTTSVTCDRFFLVPGGGGCVCPFPRVLLGGKPHVNRTQVVDFLYPSRILSFTVLEEVRADVAVSPTRKLRTENK